MIAHSRGFTVLEILVVIMLLGVVARMTVSVIPERAAQKPWLQLQESANWAWQQAQLEGRIWQMQLTPRSWQLLTMTSQQTSQPGPLPNTFWQPVKGAIAKGKISDGEFHLDDAASLPALLLFLPDGEVSHRKIVYRAANGEEQHFSLGATNQSTNP